MSDSTALQDQARRRNIAIAQQALQRKREREAIFDARLLLQSTDADLNDRDLADLLLVDRSTIRRWRAGIRCMISPYRADELACRLGVHPCSIWGNDWWAQA